jgi:hypothetical protein
MSLNLVNSPALGSVARRENDARHGLPATTAASPGTRAAPLVMDLTQSVTPSRNEPERRIVPA